MAYFAPPPYYGYGQRPLSIRSILIITAIIMVLLIGTYIYIRTDVKKKLKEELPNEYQDEMYNAEEGKKIRYYASALKDDIFGFSWSHNLTLYNNLLNENDRIFEGVCVDYKRLAGESLRKSLTDEISFSNWSSYIKVRKRMYSRMDMLNIA